MKMFKRFFRDVDKLSLFCALFCTASAVDSVQKQQWVWVFFLGIIALLNFRLALPPRYRFPKRFF